MTHEQSVFIEEFLLFSVCTIQESPNSLTKSRIRNCIIVFCLEHNIDLKEAIDKLNTLAIHKKLKFEDIVPKPAKNMKKL